MKVAFVDTHKGEHGVQPVLQALEGTPAQIAPSTYYAAKSRPVCARAVRDAELTDLIKKIHAGNSASTAPGRCGTNCTAKVST